MTLPNSSSLPGTWPDKSPEDTVRSGRGGKKKKKKPLWQNLPQNQETTHLLRPFHTHRGQQVAMGGCISDPHLALMLLQLGQVCTACSMANARTETIPLGM